MTQRDKRIFWQQLRHLPVEIWMLVIVTLALGTRLYHLSEQSLWFDEIVTVALARVSWYDGLVGLLGQGIQLTPLFHWVIKLWLAVGDTDWLVRVPAAFIGVLTVPMVFKLGQLYFGSKVGLLAAFIFAVNPYQVWYGQEVKLYTLLTFTSTGAMVAFGRMLRTRGRRGFSALLLFNLLGFTAHYFMFLVSTVQFLYIVTTLKRTYPLLRRWVVAQGVPALSLVPWWLFIIQQQHFAVGIGWIPRPRWLDPLLTLWNFSFGYTGELSFIIVTSLIVMALGLGRGLWQAWRMPTRGWLMTLWLVFPLLVSMLLSSGRISFYVDRYLLIISPVLTTLTVSGLLKIWPRWLRGVLVLAFAIATGLSLAHIYLDRANFTKDDWRALARSIDVQAGRGDVVITCTDGYRLAFEYYNPHHTLGAEDVIIAPQLAELEALTSYRTAWIITLHRTSPIHNLGRTFPPALDKTLLSSKSTAWATSNFLERVTVAGISAYRYDIADPFVLDEIVTWHCHD